MTHRMDVYGINKTPIRIIFVPKGETSPDSSSTNDKDIVAFFDLRYKHTPDGQFISRYYVDSLIDHEGGLDLQGEVYDWKIDAITFSVVRYWFLYHRS